MMVCTHRLGGDKHMGAQVLRSLRLVTSLLVVVVLVAACGDATEVTTTTASPGAPSETEAPQATDAAPTTKEPSVAAASIAEAGLPTEWLLGSPQQAESDSQTSGDDEGFVLDISFRFRSDQYSAEGKVTHELELVQGAVVECNGRTYDEEFLWSAISPGTGELDFGDSGSVTIEFEAVAVASIDAAAWPKQCWEWNGTYTGASGNLATATGTFTAVIPGQHSGEPYVITFDS